MGNLIKKILIAPNSYKESIDSVSAARLLSDYLTDESFELFSLPLSDGGDGFLEVCKEKYRHDRILEVNDEFHYIFNTATKTVYIESAEIVGMKVTPADKRNPLKLNSSALGNLLLHLRAQVELKELDIKDVVIGIGGTATMDMGLGAASSFGLSLFDDVGNELPMMPCEFINAMQISLPEIKLPFSITAINDVTNPLTGSIGGLKVYGPQKGVAQEDIDLIEKGSENILSLIHTSTAQNFSGDELPGAGGGLSTGLLLFFNAEMKSSEQFILDDLGLKDYTGKIDYVITGEGTFDQQSHYNKAAGLVIKTFNKTPVFLCCGVIDDLNLPDNVIPIELSRYFNSKEESISSMPRALQLASEVIRGYINKG